MKRRISNITRVVKKVFIRMYLVLTHRFCGRPKDINNKDVALQLTTSFSKRYGSASVVS